MVNVLVVEDEPEVAELVEDALVEAGIFVTVAPDDRTAFQKLEGEPRSFAAIVTDINLGPGVTGFDIARRARSLNEAIKVVYISGQGPHSHPVQSRSGPDDRKAIRAPQACRTDRDLLAKRAATVGWRAWRPWDSCLSL